MAGLSYYAPLWLPGGHLQTMWPPLFSQRYCQDAPKYRRERWTTPDNDFIDVDFLAEPSGTTLQHQLWIVMFHGLEGSSRSHYAEAFADFARHNHLGFAVVHFRGCSGTLNNAPRAYYSGDFEEADWILQRMARQLQSRLLAVGVSLGGNVLLRWAEEMGQSARSIVQAVVSISAPLDLAAAGQAMGVGINRQVYTRRFLNTMKPKALGKWQQYPGLFDKEALLQAQDLYQFDEVFTAPLHGFNGALDYWQKCASRPHLSSIKVPTLVINAKNDPFVPEASLPLQKEVGKFVKLWKPKEGGHVGFASGAYPGVLNALPTNVMQWFNREY